MKKGKGWWSKGGISIQFSRLAFWCTESKVVVTHSANRVLLGLVLMEKILEEKQLPKECNRQEARRLQARMVRRKDHDCVVEETIRREALEPPDCEAMKKEYGKTLAQKHLNEKEQQK